MLIACISWCTYGLVQAVLEEVAAKTSASPDNLMQTESRWTLVSAIGGVQLNWFDSDMRNMTYTRSPEEIAVRGNLATLRNAGSTFRSVRVRSCLVQPRRAKLRCYI